MQGNAADDLEEVIIKERRSRFEETNYPAIAGADPFEIPQIVDSDGRDDKIKGPSDAIDPRRVTEIGGDVADPIPIAGKLPPRVVQHWLRVILQGHPGLRERAQDFFGHNAVAAADIKHGNGAVPFQ